MNFKVDPNKSGFIVELPYNGIGILNVTLASSVDVDVYYTTEKNKDSLIKIGEFVDQGEIVFALKGIRILNENRRGVAPKGYVVIINNSAVEADVNLEIKEVISGPMPSSVAGLTGYGTSASSKF